MSEFAIKKATRQGFKPLIGLYAESGCGKSMSSLLLARGLVGPSGNITMIDTEGGRGGLYADVIPGGYNILDLEAPFTPMRYMEAIKHVEDSKADILVIDSMSHEWEGIGGVLDWATQNEADGKKGRQVWKDPKMAHERMVGKLLQTRLPIICCLRAKHLLVERIDEKTKRKEMIKDPNATPKQADDFVSNMTVHAEILPDHSLRVSKVNHPSIAKCFPDHGPITIQHGELLAKWCAASQPIKPPANPLKSELWKLTAGIHKGDTKALLSWIVDELGLQTVTSLESLTDDELETVLAKARQKLSERRAA